MNREEMIAFCFDTTNAERKRRNLTNTVPREVYENLSDADLKSIVERLKALLPHIPR